MTVITAASFPGARFVRLVSVALALAGSIQPQSQAGDLTDMSLQDLMAIKVTSVSKKEQPLSRSAAAISVITREEIARSGMTTLPDLLRLAPGVDVAQISANTWAISIRGFNYRYSTKVLVMIDGRTVYTPGFSGVYWDQQSVPLEDIERIEIIRGPGGTMWGANAVNGVINIITKNANDTQGGLVRAGAGTKETTRELVQYGSGTNRGSYRIYSQHFQVGSSSFANGSRAADAWHGVQGGFRSDWKLTGRDAFTAQGDIFGTSEGQNITTPFSNHLGVFTFDDKVRVATGNVLGRWTHTLQNGSEATVQAYYDRFRRFDQALDVLNTGDVDFQYRFQALARHDVIAGGGYRVTGHSYTGGYAISFGSGHRRDQLYSAMIADEIKLNSHTSLMLGSKFERNSYTGFEYEPSVQLAWSPSARQTLWGSASKAVEQPSWYFAESELNAAAFPLPGGKAGVFHLSGNPNGKASQLFDYEAGYRMQVTPRITLDAIGFVSDYHRLHTLEPRPPVFQPGPAPIVIFPNVWDNLGHARDSGVEISAKWDAASRWRLSFSYGFLQMKLRADPRSGDALFTATPGDSPKHQAQVHSSLDLTRHMEWDASAFYVSALRTGPVPSYVRMDTRLAWRKWESLDFSLAGQNLLRPRHFEFLDAIQVNPTQAQRSVFAQVTYRF